MVQQVSSVLQPLQRAMQEPLALARTTCDELRRWLSDIEAGERENTGGYGRWKMTCRDPPNLGLCCG